MAVILDTSFLIDVERKDPGALRVLKTLAALPEPLLVPTIVLAQFLVGAKDKEQALERITRHAEIIDLDIADALATSDLARELNRKGIFPGWSDTLIGGSAKARGNIPVVTRNLKGFSECETITY